MNGGTPATAPTTIAQAMAQALARGLERLDAQLLLLHAMGRDRQDRAWLLAHDTDALAADAQARFEALARRRLQGEPVAYLVGEKEFFGMRLRVDRRVLVPRPDTETLVEWSLEVLQGRTAPRVIDLGTGSGAIALAIKHCRPDAQVQAVDLSEDALALARDNAAALGLEVEFRHAAWLDGAGEGWDLVVSNPPYIAQGDAHLAALAHEPHSALAAGADGLDDIRAIVQQAPQRMAPGAWLLLEHGWDQAGAVRALLQSAGLHGACSRRDLAGIERCSGGQRTP